jgi:hypothetical protein
MEDKDFRFCAQVGSKLEKKMLERNPASQPYPNDKWGKQMNKIAENKRAS